MTSTRQLLLEGVTDAAGFLGGALAGYGIGRMLGLDIFTEGYDSSSITGIVLVGLGCGLGRHLARRGGGARGARPPPRRGWPSGPIALRGASGRKYSQCHSGGTASSGCGAAPARSSVAASAASGCAASCSCRVSLFPCQDCRCATAAASRGADGAEGVDGGMSVMAAMVGAGATGRNLPL